MIVGVLIASLMPLYTQYEEAKKVQATQVNISMVIGAIGSFRSLYGRYPCPAPLTANRNNPDYGHEQCADFAALATNSCNGEFCVERGMRTFPSFQYPAVPPTLHTNAQPRIIVGALPFRELNLSEDQAYDGYDGRLMYVVTEHLTCANCFQPEQGGINIVNSNGNTVLKDAGSAHFMVFSYGKNGAGSFTKNGSSIGCPATGPENENCDFNLGNFDGTYRVTPASTATTTLAGNGPYDDVVDYFTQDEMPLWQMSTNPAPAARRAIHQKPTGEVAIMMPAADIAQQGDIGGTVRVTAETPVDPAIPTGRVISNRLCTSGSANCFEPSVIGGRLDPNPLVPGGMTCPQDDEDYDASLPGGGPETGQFMVAIKFGKPVCSNTVTDDCEDGTFATGIDGSGEMECSALPGGCPTIQVQLCSLSFEVTAGPEGTRRTITAGNSGTQVYICNNGQWLAEGAMTGSCSCTPTNGNVTSSCGAGYTGTRVDHVVRVCPSGVRTSTPVSNNCVCANNYRQTRTRSCPTGYNGSIPQERFFRCGPPNTWGDWLYLNGETQAQATARNCSCSDRTETRYVACGANQNGSIEELRTIRCTGSGVEIGEWAPVAGGNHCEDKVCRWRTSSQPQGPYAFTNGGVDTGSSCNCGASRKCYSYNQGLYTHYQTCRCE